MVSQQRCSQRYADVSNSAGQKCITKPVDEIVPASVGGFISMTGTH
jgi:hypothetical protein